ncbi:hypothetical protein AB0B28_08045 [Glycomyces sp. NPDC046736]|uniref:hypothetical protein n=1 Tax=Glycomyces sp. NPDC046736 TaxID=3155615 RepID=UPI0033F7D1F8
MPPSRSRYPKPPEVDGRFNLVGGPLAVDGGNLEIWGDSGTRTALLRLIDDGGELDAGTVARGGTPEAVVKWSAEVLAGRGTEWMERQAGRVRTRLAYAWGAI